MYDYIVSELPGLVEATLQTTGVKSIMGHSMGGHGALTIGLKNPGAYKSISAFSPICNPIKCPWGKKAFAGYLGADEEAWKAYDATEIMLSGKAAKYSDILIDVSPAVSSMPCWTFSPSMQHPLHPIIRPSVHPSIHPSINQSIMTP
jgi:S-formylglutathione hydrolase